ncbi:MAG: hypothetical protein ABSD68_01890 [Candidatus Micrarchaeales archaeon]
MTEFHSVFKRVGICDNSFVLTDSSMVKGRKSQLFGGIDLASFQVFRGSENIGMLIPRGYSVDEEIADRTCSLFYLKNAEWDNKTLLETERLKRRDDEGLLRSIVSVRRLSDELAAKVVSIIDAKIKEYLFFPEADAIVMGLQDGDTVLVQSNPVFMNLNSVEIGKSVDLSNALSGGLFFK